MMKKSSLLIFLFIAFLSVFQLSINKNNIDTLSVFSHEKINIDDTDAYNGLSAEIKQLIKKQPGYYAIAIKDLTTGKKILINNREMRSASVIKVFVMIEAFRQAERDELDLNEKIVLNNAMKVGGTGLLQKLPAGTRISYNKLIELMITESDNTATNILIEKIGIKNINNTAKDLGCHNTQLVNLLMRKPISTSGAVNVTSVRDLMLVFEKIYKNECLGPPYDKKMLAIMTRVKSRDRIPLLLPGDCKIAHKTGCIRGHEHDAGIVYTAKGDYIICIMSMKLPSSIKGKRVISEISKLVYNQHMDAKPLSN